jgi:hypothetical protein
MYFRRNCIILVLSTTILLICSCSKGTEPPQASVPVLTTTSVSGITPTSAASGGNITSDGGAAITARGVCWSTNQNPTVTDSKTDDGTGTGNFTSTITGLDSNTIYNIRAYATNSTGTGYGNTITFSTTTNTTYDYLGQTAPGLTPEPFAHNIFRNFALHSSPAFSPAGDEVYWSCFNMSMQGNYKNQIWYMRKVNNTWTSPQVALSLLNGVGDSPVFSPDGQKLFFLSGAPTPDNPNNTKENLWYSNKTVNGWSAPILLHQEFDSYIFHWQVSVANNGNIYFSGSPINSPNNDERDIYLTHFINGEYKNIINLGSSVNTVAVMECTPWISPDESYVIFSRGGASDFSELYISFKNPDGTWTSAKNMTAVNSPYHDLNPIITPDGKYLIYTSQQDGWPYWVDVSVIEQYR